jgi:putative SOS response-associated peptidase YedK
MPVIIAERDYERWLQPGDPDRPPIDLLRPYGADKMTAWKVNKAVGSVKNDTPELLEEKDEGKTEVYSANPPCVCSEATFT